MIDGEPPDIIRANIRRLEELIAGTLDSVTRDRARRLLAEARADLALAATLKDGLS